MRFNPINLDFELGANGGSTPSTGWVRPSTWPVIESLVGSNEGVMLVKVFPNTPIDYLNIINIKLASLGTGSTTVDWGDGNTTTQTTTTSASLFSYTYTYSNPLLIDNGEGWKYAIIKITSPVNISQFYSESTSQIIDLDFNFNKINRCEMSKNGYIEQICIRNGEFTNMDPWFSNCTNLKKIKNLYSTLPVTVMNQTFQHCPLLEEINENLTLNLYSLNVS